MGDSQLRRREALSVLSAATLCSVAGCSGGGGGAIGTPGRVDNCAVEDATVSVSTTWAAVDGRLPEADAAIDLKWTARSQRSVADSSAAATYHEADQGMKYIVYRVRLTNTTTDQQRVGSRQLADLLHETSETEEYTQLLGLSLDAALAPVTLDPDGTTSGVLVFEIPATAESATLEASVPAETDTPPLAFDPSCEPSLSVGVPEHDDVD